MRKISFMIGLLFVIITGCNGENNNAGKAMPITEDNINTYIQKMYQSSKSIAVGEEEIDKLIKIYKYPLEDMGYNFDTTILHSIKVLSKAPLTQVTVNAGKILNNILLGITRNPKSSVNKGFISQDTQTKVLTYLKFKELKPKTIKALQYVAKCQNKSGGICDIKQYVQILLDNNFVTPPPYIKDRNAFRKLSVEAVFTNKVNDLVFAFKSSFDNQVNYSEFGRYLVNQNGQKINANGFIASWRKPFKLKDEAIIMELNSYNPWWIN